MRPRCALLPWTFYAYMRSTIPALGFMFEWIFLAGLGAKVKRDRAKPLISPFWRQFFIPLSNVIGTNFSKPWLYSTRAPCGHTPVPAGSSAPVMRLL